MTKAYALEVLKTPKFGDPVCILAVETLGVEAESLRRKLLGQPMVCPLCDGRSDNCKLCDPDGTMKITQEMVDGWDLDQLQSACEEVFDKV